MPYPTLPAETTYSDIERNLIENEPPGAFPEDQNSYWGQMRKVFADYMQANAIDLFTAWYANLDPRAVDINDINEWEDRVGVPGDRTALTLAARQSFVQNRLVYGAFTRSLVNRIIENFINAVLVVGSGSTSFGAGGAPFGAGGMTLYSGVSGDPKTMYRVYYDHMNRVYYVRILNTLGEDLGGLTRELQRITPGGWTLNISDVANPLLYGKSVLDLAPLQWYQFDGNANDSSGYSAFPGTGNGGMTFAAATLVSAAAGGGTAAVLDGVDDYVSIPDAGGSWPFATTGTPFSVEAWIKPSALPSAGNYKMIWSKGLAYFGLKDAAGTLNFNTGSGADLSFNFGAATGTIYHVAATYDGVTAKLYVNGALVASGARSAGSLVGGTNVGRAVATTNGYFSGNLDDVAVYDRVLTVAQVLSHFKTGTNVA